jgi:tetratricopeptide (TPR) repeat protein
LEQYEQPAAEQSPPEAAESAAEETMQPPVISPIPANEMLQPPEMPMSSGIPAADAAPTPTMDLSRLSIAELEARVSGDAMDSDARFALARRYLARGQTDRAITLYQETLRLDPTNADAQNDLGVALQSRGKRTEAEAAYRRAVALDPFSSTAHLNLGLLLSGMKRPAEASQEFYQARQNARGGDETRAAEAASTGAKMDPVLSKV